MATIIGENLPNIPWEEKPAGCKDVVWRYSQNPIVERDQIPGSNSIFNSAVVAKDGAFAGIFRSDNTAMEQHLFLGKSSDAIHWDIEPEPLPLYGKDDKQCGVACGYEKARCREISRLTDEIYAICSTLGEAMHHADAAEDTLERAMRYKDDVIGAMDALRKACDACEAMTPDDQWPYPSYTDMLFSVK